MKWWLIIILSLSIAFLGCEKTDQPTINEDGTKDNGKLESGGKNPESKTGVWLTDWNDAMKTADVLNRSVLVDFTGSDWCIWCKKLEEEVFGKGEFLEYAKKNLVLLKVDFPRDIEQSEELQKFNEQKMKEYGIQGFPTIVLVNSKGEEIARTGYRPGGAKEYVKHLQELLQPKE